MNGSVSETLEQGFKQLALPNLEGAPILTRPSDIGQVQINSSLIFDICELQKSFFVN